MHCSKLVAMLLALCVIFTLAACENQAPPTSDELDDISVSTPSEEEKPKEPEIIYEVNPLTGEKNLLPEAKGKKPVAVVVNNIRMAQPVQAGLHMADVVFETEVEGGITRLLALFSDPTAVPAVGTIRSLRVPFAEIACGMDSILFYHGIDHTYALPLLPSLPMKSFTVDSKTYGYREKNGLPSEHTLYTTGEKIDKAIADRKFNYESTRGNWLNFSAEDKPLVPATYSVGTAKVSFSSTTETQFIYDAETGRYNRARKGEVYTDLTTGQKEQFTNVFVLKTSISNYPDGYHRKVDLSSGQGYYITAGGAEDILWRKGSASNNFVFTKADGTQLTVNPGNSYVCLINSSRPINFEPIITETAPEASQPESSAQ